MRKHLRFLAGQGIETSFAVLFGSRATNKADEWSDLDIVVVSPLFDESFSRDTVNRLWRAAARVDSRIEPIPCGERRWKEDAISPILEAARQEGVRVSLHDNA